MSISDLEIKPRVQLSDPQPAFCSMCARGADGSFRMFDCQAAFDAGAFQDENLSWVHGSDDLHICEACVRELCEAAGLKPEQSRRQLNEIRRLEILAERWEAYAKRLEATLQDRPEPAR